MARAFDETYEPPKMRKILRQREHRQTNRYRRRRSSMSHIVNSTIVQETIKSTKITASKDFNTRFTIGVKLGSGSFGQVYRGRDKQTGENVAVKVEKYQSIQKETSTTLYKEYSRYLVLHSSAKTYGPTAGIPRAHLFSVMNDKVILVMDELGPNLETLFNKCGRSFSLKTLTMIAVQLLDNIEFIHSCRCLHRDVKPENFCIGPMDEPIIEKRNRIYIIDFGLAKSYSQKCDEKEFHIPSRTGKNLCGTARYVSIRSHDGYEQSRRDDLEAISYLLLYFARGTLPWMGLVPPSNRKPIGNKDDKYRLIGEKKKEWTAEQLCQGLECADELREMINYTRHELGFEDKPDYDYLKKRFIDLFNRHCFANDNVYDWDDLPQVPSISSAPASPAGLHTSNIAVKASTLPPLWCI